MFVYLFAHVPLVVKPVRNALFHILCLYREGDDIYQSHMSRSMTASQICKTNKFCLYSMLSVRILHLIIHKAIAIWNEVIETSPRKSTKYIFGILFTLLLYNTFKGFIREFQSIFQAFSKISYNIWFISPIFCRLHDFLR